MDENLFVTPPPGPEDDMDLDLAPSGAENLVDMILNQASRNPDNPNVEDEDELIGESITLTPIKHPRSVKPKRRSTSSGKDTSGTQASSSNAGEEPAESDFYTGPVPKNKAQVLVPVGKKQDSPLASVVSKKASSSAKTPRSRSKDNMSTPSVSEWARRFYEEKKADYEQKKRSAEQMSSDKASDKASFTQIPKALGRYAYHIYDHGEKPGVEPGKVVVRNDDTLEKKFQDWGLYNNFRSMESKDDSTWPPQNVVLQDWHIYEIYRAQIPKSKYYKRWPADFDSVGQLREHRRNKGRAAKVKGDDGVWRYVVVGEHFVLCGDEGFGRVKKLIAEDFQKPLEFGQGEKCVVQQDFVPTKRELLLGLLPKRFTNTNEPKQSTSTPETNQAANTLSAPPKLNKARASRSLSSPTPISIPTPTPSAPPSTQQLTSILITPSTTHSNNDDAHNTRNATKRKKPKKNARVSFAAPIAQMMPNSNMQLNSLGGAFAEKSSHQPSHENARQFTSPGNDSNLSTGQETSEGSSTELSQQPSSPPVAETLAESVETQGSFTKRVVPLSFSLQQASSTSPGYLAKELVTFITNTQDTSAWVSAAFSNIAAAIESAADYSYSDPARMAELLNNARQYAYQLADDVEDRQTDLLAELMNRTHGNNANALRQEIDGQTPHLTSHQFAEGVDERLMAPTPRTPVFDFSTLSNVDFGSTGSEGSTHDPASSVTGDSEVAPSTPERPTKAAKIETPSTAGKQQQLATNALSATNNTSNDDDSSTASAVNMDGAADSDSSSHRAYSTTTDKELTMTYAEHLSSKNNDKELNMTYAEYLSSNNNKRSKTARGRAAKSMTTAATRTSFKSFVFKANPATRPLNSSVAAMNLDGADDFDSAPTNEDAAGILDHMHLAAASGGGKSGKPTPYGPGSSCVIQ